MLFKTVAAIFSVAFLSSCGLISIDMQFNHLDSRYELTPSEKDAVQAEIVEWIGPAAQPPSLKLKALGSGHGRVNVCGMANGNRFFVGYLHRTAQGAVFEVRHMTNTNAKDSKYEIDVQKLCKG